MKKLDFPDNALPPADKAKPEKEIRKDEMEKWIDYFGNNIAFWEDELAQYDAPDDCPMWRKLKEDVEDE